MLWTASQKETACPKGCLQVSPLIDLAALAQEWETPGRASRGTESRGAAGRAVGLRAAPALGYARGPGKA